MAEDSDLVEGNDYWIPFCKKADWSRNWSESTSVMNTPVGVVLKVTTRHMDNISVSVCYLPDVKVVRDRNDDLIIMARERNSYGHIIPSI